MSAQAISLASLICAGRSQRARAMRGSQSGTRDGHATEFQEGMLELGRRQLAKDEILVLPAIDATLVCLEGELWLTRDGDPEDYILGAGNCMRLGSRDRAMLQALQSSRVHLITA
ncbi:MAG: DUF2917 domain-containing protein [Sterolibacteriaceae bacterium]|nr:DUF2917 domain-containing protein [Sterolibacteriaceae bacterium]